MNLKRLSDGRAVLSSLITSYFAFPLLFAWEEAVDMLYLIDEIVLSFGRVTDCSWFLTPVSSVDFFESLSEF